MKSVQSDSFTGILLGGTSGSEMLRNLWAFKKALEPKFSLAYVVKKIGFPSRGTLLETIKGRRRWPRKYWKPMCQALGLDETQTEFLSYLLEMEECKSEADLVAINYRIEGLRRFLTERFVKIDLNHGLTLLASDVLCYFGIQNRPVTERMIIDFFGKSRVMDILQALHVLIINGLLEKQDGVYTRTAKTQPFFSFHQNESDYAQAYICEAIQDAKNHVPHWLPREKDACFGSTVMSVNRASYEKILVQIKKDVFRYFSQLETNDGDTLIRFNMQIYPLQDNDGES